MTPRRIAGDRFVERALLMLPLLIPVQGCGGDEPVQESPVLTFEQDVEAQRFLNAVRAGFGQGNQPGGVQMQRLRKIGKTYPDEALVESTLLSILVARKDWGDLASYLEGKTQLTDEQRILLTRVYIKKADYVSALRAAKSVADSNPSHVEANALAGRANYYLGNNAAAIGHYDRVWSSIVDQNMLAEIASRAMLHFDGGNLEEATQLLRSTLEGHPDSIELHNALSRVLAAAGDAEGAEQHSQRVVELQAEISRSEHIAQVRAAQTATLNSALKKGDFDECQRLIYEFLPEAEESFQEELYRFLGRMYEAAEREPEASAAVERARQHARSGGR